MENGALPLAKGELLDITTDDMLGRPGLISTIYQALPHDVKPGSRILMDDGLIELKVLSVTEGVVHCTVVEGGILKDLKGINLPGVNVSSPSLTEKDRVDLEFCLEMEVDFIALSFVRKSEDVEELKRIIFEHGLNIPVVAKIEKPEALRNFKSILKAADAVMVARGDLGVEIAAEKVPLIQKKIIRACNDGGEAGHHRHPDARIDDQPPPPDPGRDLGRGQRHSRRHRCGHALRGDRFRPVPGGGGEDHGQGRPRRGAVRTARLRCDGRTAAATYPRRWRRRPARRPRPSRPRPPWSSPSRAARPGSSPNSAPSCRSSPLPPSRRSSAGSPSPGGCRPVPIGTVEGTDQQIAVVEKTLLGCRVQEGGRGGDHHGGAGRGTGFHQPDEGAQAGNRRVLRNVLIRRVYRC